MISLATLGVVVYFFVPLWGIAAAIVVLGVVPVVVRHNRHRARR